MPTPAGTRVVAIRNVTDTHIYLYGHGVYVGDRRRPGITVKVTPELIESNEKWLKDSDNYFTPVRAWTSLTAQMEKGELTLAEAQKRYTEYCDRITQERRTPMAERVQKMIDGIGSNPCIELDSGDTIWGFECWWGPEGSEANYLPRVIEIVPVPDRSKYDTIEL